jgi:class 3 adenylate cyclase
VSISCPHCHRRNRNSARFCDGCAARLTDGVVAARPALADEQRHGTFLSCDIKDYARLTNQLDLEDVSTIIATFRSVVSRVVLQHGGHLYPFEGDGAFASFGSEDADESAVSAGLALTAAMQSARPVPGVNVEIRVGIASGTVGSKAESFKSPVGEAPNLAARLQAIAPPNGVVIADSTRRQAGLYFDYQDFGQFVLKGFKDPVRAWRVVGETTVASRFEAQRFRGSTTTLVGRATALARLLGDWDETRRGAGRAVVLAGDAGIGKSRLARALLEQAKHDGAVRLQLDCMPRTRRIPLHPVARILRRIVGVRVVVPQVRERRLQLLLRRLLDPESVEAAACYLAPLAGVDVEGCAPDESAERVRERTLGTLVCLITTIAERKPTVLLVEDIHWADPTTLLLLRRLGEELPSRALLVLVTTRSSPDKVKLPGAVVTLDPLDDVAAQSIVRHTAARDALADHVVERIVRQAEGNPLFIEELTRDVVERASANAGTGQQSVVVAADVPVSLKLTISARLDRHSRLKPFIQAASVLGREFPIRLLQDLLPHSREELPEAVAQLVNLGLLAGAGAAEHGYVRFKHALIRQAVYRTIFRSDRQRLHSRAADILVHHFADTAEASADTLAHHLTAAGRFEEAIHCRIDAGGSTARRAAYGESTAHCRAGLELVGMVTNSARRDQLKLELLTQLGVALSATLGYATPEVENVYQQARALCDQYAPPQVLFPIVRGLGTFYFVRGRLDAAAEVSDSCIRLAAESNRPDFQIEALSFRGYTCTYRGELKEARTALETCLDLYRTHKGHDLRYPSPQDAGTAAWSLLPITTWLLGDPVAAEAATSGAIRHTEQLGGPFDTAYVHVWLAMLRNMQRRFADAETHAAACIDIAQRHGFSTWLVAATMHACISKGCRAASPESTVTLRQMLDAFFQAGAEANATFFLWGLAQGLRVADDRAAARDVIVEALDRATASGELYFKSELLTLAAEIDEDDDRACALLREALAVALEQRAIPMALRAAVEVVRRKSGNRAPLDSEGHALTSLSPLPDDGPSSAALLSEACNILGFSAAGGASVAAL